LGILGLKRLAVLVAWSLPDGTSRHVLLRASFLRDKARELSPAPVLNPLVGGLMMLAQHGSPPDKNLKPDDGNLGEDDPSAMATQTLEGLLFPQIRAYMGINGPKHTFHGHPAI
jgi:hypothetical protein